MHRGATWRHCAGRLGRRAAKAIKGGARSNDKEPTSSQEVLERIGKGRRRQEEAGEDKSARRIQVEPNKEAPGATKKGHENNEQPERCKGIKLAKKKHRDNRSPPKNRKRDTMPKKQQKNAQGVVLCRCEAAAK